MCTLQFGLVPRFLKRPSACCCRPASLLSIALRGPAAASPHTGASQKNLTQKLNPPSTCKMKQILRGATDCQGRVSLTPLKQTNKKTGDGNSNEETALSIL